MGQQVFPYVSANTDTKSFLDILSMHSRDYACELVRATRKAMHYISLCHSVLSIIAKPYMGLNRAKCRFNQSVKTPYFRAMGTTLPAYEPQLASAEQPGEAGPCIGPALRCSSFT